MKRKKYIFMTVLFLVMTLIQPVSAHSGRTDSSGGHHDNKNASGLGSYHYHHGYPPHLHPDGICPYAPNDTIEVSNWPSNMYVGESVALAWTVTYYSGNSSVYWSSSNNSVASVTSDGFIKANSPGTATITATLHNGSKTFEISVKPVYASAIQTTEIIEKLEIGETSTVKASVEPSNTTDKTLTWKSSNENVATISAGGVISALSTGTTTINISAVGGVNTSFPLEVYEIYPENINVSSADVKLPLNNETGLTAAVFPDNTTRPDIEWISGDESIATVNNGVLHGVSEGQTVVSVKCQNIVTEIYVEVYEIDLESLTIEQDSLNLVMDKYLDIDSEVTPVITFNPVDATYQDYSIISNDESVIRVDGHKLVAVGEGPVTITVNSGNISKDIEISVVNPSKIIVFGMSGVIICAAGIGVFYKAHKKKLNI